MHNVYQKEIQGFSHLVALLTRLIKKNQKFEWKNEEKRAFEELKKRMTTSPMLVLPDFYKIFKVHTNASIIAIREVLLQEDRSIAYFNKKHNDANRDYRTYNLKWCK